MKPTPRVILVAPPKDIHAFAVSKVLTEKLHCPNIILDLNQFPDPGIFRAELGGCGAAFALLHPDELHLNSDITVWWRRPGSFRVDDTITDARLRRFVTQECWKTFDGMLYASGCRLVNNRLAEERAENKILQLRHASQCGFNIPKTLVTNSPRDVHSFLSTIDGPVIYKAQTDARYHLAETRLLDQPALEKLGLISLCPVVFQEFVPASYDIRLTVVGHRMFATKILSQQDRPKIDWRIDPFTPMETMEVSDEFAHPAIKLMQTLGLEYGAIDLRVTPEGQIVFFEVNPSGQFLFCELDGKLEITTALAELLAA